MAYSCPSPAMTGNISFSMDVGLSCTQERKHIIKCQDQEASTGEVHTYISNIMIIKKKSPITYYIEYLEAVCLNVPICEHVSVRVSPLFCWACWDWRCTCRRWSYWTQRPAVSPRSDVFCRSLARTPPRRTWRAPPPASPSSTRPQTQALDSSYYFRKCFLLFHCITIIRIIECAFHFKTFNHSLISDILVPLKKVWIVVDLFWSNSQRLDPDLLLLSSWESSKQPKSDWTSSVALNLNWEIYSKKQKIKNVSLMCNVSNLPRWFPPCRGCCETAAYLWRENHRSRLSSGQRRARCRRWEGLWPAPGGPLHTNTQSVKSFSDHYVKLLVRALSVDDELWCYKPNSTRQQSRQFLLRSVMTTNSPVPRGSFSWDREIRIPSWGEKSDTS